MPIDCRKVQPHGLFSAQECCKMIVNETCKGLGYVPFSDPTAILDFDIAIHHGEGEGILSNDCSEALRDISYRERFGGSDPTPYYLSGQFVDLYFRQPSVQRGQEIAEEAANNLLNKKPSPQAGNCKHYGYLMPDQIASARATIQQRSEARRARGMISLEILKWGLPVLGFAGIILGIVWFRKFRAPIHRAPVTTMIDEGSDIASLTSRQVLKTASKSNVTDVTSLAAGFLACLIPSFYNS